MSNIAGYVTEIEQIDIEIKRLNATLKRLRAQKSAAEGHITEFFQSNNMPGGKMRGKEIRIVPKPRRAYKGKKDKEADAIDVLREYGIHDPREALLKLQDAQRGDEVESYKLKIRQI